MKHLESSLSCKTRLRFPKVVWVTCVATMIQSVTAFAQHVPSAGDPDPNGARVGVQVRDSPGTGILVNTVSIGSPADLHGIRPGDFLLSADGKPVEIPSDFFALVAQSQPGSEMELGLWREGEEYRVRLIPATTADVTHPSERAWLGVTLDTSDSRGARIAQVIPESPAANANLSPGDVVIAINNISIRSARDLANAVERYKAHEKITLTLQGEPPVTRELELGPISQAPAIMGFRLPLPVPDPWDEDSTVPSERWRLEMQQMRTEIQGLRNALRRVVGAQSTESATPEKDASEDDARASDTDAADPIDTLSQEDSIRYLMAPQGQRMDQRRNAYRQRYDNSYRYRTQPNYRYQYRYGSPAYPYPQWPNSGYWYPPSYPSTPYYGPYYRPGVRVYVGPYGFQYYYR